MGCCMAQELDDQALEVLQAAKATEALLAEKAESLAAIRTEFERKQKEVLAFFCHFSSPSVAFLPTIKETCKQLTAQYASQLSCLPERKHVNSLLPSMLHSKQ